MKDQLKDRMEGLEEASPMEMEGKMEETLVKYHQREIGKVDRKKRGLYPLVLEGGKNICQQGKNHHAVLPYSCPLRG